MRNEAEVNRALKLYADTVRRICFMYLKNDADVEDESDAHEKAWLIRVSINACRDVLKSFFRKKVRSIEEIDVEPFYIQEQDKELLDAVLRLPPKYRNVIYLFYYEGYTAVEIAGILKKSENTVYTWLDRGRKELKKQLGGEWIGE